MSTVPRDRSIRPRSSVRIVAVIAILGLLGLTGRASAAGLLLADGGFGGALEVKEHAAKVTINNGIAVTEVTQVFLNTEDRQVEALYTFPVPRGASVANFSMWINGKEMTGEVLEKKRAREIYESYKQTRRDPGLLEQTDYRTFEMRIFPIGPKAEQRVQVTYYQELDLDHDWATYVYPLSTKTRQNLQDGSAGQFSLSVDVKSEIPIVEMNSPSHDKDVAVAKHSDGYYQASLEAKDGDLTRDVVLAFHCSRPRTGVDVITSKTGNEDGYFALTLTAGEELAAASAAMDYVFVLDVSGSMNEDGKLDMSRRSLAAFIEQLGEEDRFEVLTFNLQPNPLFKNLRNANGEAKTEATNFLNGQQGRGGTVLNPALTTAYKYASNDGRPLNVIVLSDGMTEQNERATLAGLIKQRPAGSRVFAIGVGNDVNRGLLEQIANDSRGLAAFVSRDDNFERQAQAFRRKLLRPVATDLAIGFAGADVYDVEPKQLPNLYHGMPVRVYGRYKHDGKADREVTLTLSGTIAGHELKRSNTIKFPAQDDANPEIERMWAWHRVDRLLKQADANGTRTPVIDEIVRLGEGYSIVTEYTSFIVLENDGEYKRWKIDRKNALRIARDRGQQKAVASRLAKLREQATTEIGPVDPSAKLPELPGVASPNVQQASANPASAQPQRGGSAPAQRNGQGFDLTPGRGGGAIDPLTAAGMACLVVILWRVGRAKPRHRNA